MTDNAATSAENTYSYYPVYQALFETADMASMFWQPLLKAVGRSQLELAALQARQAGLSCNGANRSCSRRRRWISSTPTRNSGKR